MFGTSVGLADRYHADLTVTGNASDRAEFAVSFEALLDVVRRMIDAGRIRDDGESVIAGRLWSITHGEVLLEIAGFFGHEGHGSPKSWHRSPSTYSSGWATIARGSSSRSPLPRRGSGT